MSDSKGDLINLFVSIEFSKLFEFQGISIIGNLGDFISKTFVNQMDDSWISRRQVRSTCWIFSMAEYKLVTSRKNLIHNKITKTKLIGNDLIYEKKSFLFWSGCLFVIPVFLNLFYFISWKYIYNVYVEYLKWNT